MKKVFIIVLSMIMIIFMIIPVVSGCKNNDLDKNTGSSSISAATIILQAVRIKIRLMIRKVPLTFQTAAIQKKQKKFR